MLKAELKKRIHAAIARKYPDAPAVDTTVDEPSAGIAADLASNAALALAKQAKRPPQEIAETLAAEIGADALVEKVEVSRNGFLNFTLRGSGLQAVVRQICADPEGYGQRPEDPSKPRTLIEFVSANPTGPLHIGHGRGAALGDSLARVYRRCGYPTQTEYYVNDLGFQMQILADSVRVRQEQLKGVDVPFLENGYKGAYVQDIARMMLDRKREDFSVFPRTYILDWIRKDLEDFGVGFDSWFSETGLHESGKVGKTLKKLESKGYLKEKDGALWFAGPGAGGSGEEQDKERVLRKSDGKYTYFASDIAYHLDKFDRGFRHCIDIWGHDHHGYVPRVEASLAAFNVPQGALHILLYQLVSLKRGGKKVAMSTRSGEFVTLREILDEVGRDACRFFFALRSPSSQLEFDVDLAKKQSNENPVYYVQYVHARIRSIFREAEKRGILVEFRIPEGGSALLAEPEERALMKKLGFLGDMQEAALQVSSPHLLATYLLDCATAFHKFYDRHRVLDAEPRVRQARFALLRATQAVVKIGLSLLGVSAPEKM